MLVISPFSREVVGEVKEDTDQEIVEIFDQSSDTICSLSKCDRKQILLELGNDVKVRKQDYASLASEESGLSLRDTLYEVDRVRNVALYASEFTKEVYEDVSINFRSNYDQKNISMTVKTRPYRFILGITPFNHPINQVAHKILPAIAAGANIVVKPSNKTPLSAINLVEKLWKLGVPKSLVNIVNSNDPNRILDLALSHKGLDMISFTGSYETGNRINRRLANSNNWNKKFVCELGGSSPLIVTSTADVSLAVKLIIDGCFKNSGQRCSAIRRVLVHQSIAPELLLHLTQATNQLKVGEPLDSETYMGTQISSEAAQLIREKIQEAQGRGAEIVFDKSLKGAFLGPVILDHVTHDMPIVATETFGPVCCIIRGSSDAELLKMARYTDYGLAAGIISKDSKLLENVAENIDVGQLNINSYPGFRSEAAPFGGRRRSGNGEYEGVVMAINGMRYPYTTYKHKV
jgi:acyl-CoA reductase-like NAD-dependent aldehyde dehydrogenase